MLLGISDIRQGLSVNVPKVSHRSDNLRHSNHTAPGSINISAAISRRHIHVANISQCLNRMRTLSRGIHNFGVSAANELHAHWYWPPPLDIESDILFLHARRRTSPISSCRNILITSRSSCRKPPPGDVLSRPSQ